MFNKTEKVGSVHETNIESYWTLAQCTYLLTNTESYWTLAQCTYLLTNIESYWTLAQCTYLLTNILTDILGLFIYLVTI